jgi:hypothetical protein
VVSGVGRAGTFSIHLKHGAGMRPDTVQRALGYLGVSRDEFAHWLDRRR